MLDFAIRNRKEIFRDPLSIILGIALPVILLFLFTAIEKNAPLDTFKIQHLAPGLIVFGFAFLTMFSALLIAKDKQTALLTRLFASPLKTADYVIGYAIPMSPLAILQIVICFIAAAGRRFIRRVDESSRRYRCLVAYCDDVRFLRFMFRGCVYGQTNFRYRNDLYYTRAISGRGLDGGEPAR